MKIGKALADNTGTQESLPFLPNQISVGIEPPRHPLVDVRDGTYADSFARRNSRAARFPDCNEKIVPHRRGDSGAIRVSYARTDCARAMLSAL